MVWPGAVYILIALPLEREFQPAVFGLKHEISLSVPEDKAGSWKGPADELENDNDVYNPQCPRSQDVKPYSLRQMKAFPY